MTEHWWRASCQTPDLDAEAQATHHQTQLTKPIGALGTLESVAIRLAALQATTHPHIQRPWMSVFAADHGVAAEGVSAYPQAVTVHMLRNFVNGGAAVSVLAKAQNIPLDIVDLGTVDGDLDLPCVQHLRLGLGTANFVQQPAMTETQCLAALAAGHLSVQRALAYGADLFLAGELGIGNTTVAAALACALTGLSAEQLAGPGSGLNAVGVQHKQRVIAQALRVHQQHLKTPWDILRCLGGFELAALAGAYIACAQAGIPAVVDGFICTAAALCAVHLNPEVKPWLLFAHHGAEPGHQYLLEYLDAEPLLNLNLRLGEGSAAALAVPLIQLACTLHNKMATFSEAAVPEATA